jgi:glycosyltransferase involved in cell wall biosynthesis
VVAARRSAPDLELRIVGTGPEKAALEALIAEHDATEHISFTGRVTDDELVDLYRSAWMVASSSVREGWGMTLTEAAACGTPAVATRIAGHVDAISEGVSGLLADDGTDLARLIARVATDRELRESLQAGASGHASTFTWSNTATRILETLVDEARGRPRTAPPAVR